MGAEKRPTDHLEPAPKKRGSERQITKDDVSEEEEQVRLSRFFKTLVLSMIHPCLSDPPCFQISVMNSDLIH